MHSSPPSNQPNVEAMNFWCWFTKKDMKSSSDWLKDPNPKRDLSMFSRNAARLELFQPPTTSILHPHSPINMLPWES